MAKDTITKTTLEEQLVEQAKISYESGRQEGRGEAKEIKRYDKEILAALNEFDATFQNVVYDSDRRIFQSGKRAGIREAVEFVMPRLDKISEYVGNIRCDWIDPRSDCRAMWEIIAEIEAKLKDWGISV